MARPSAVAALVLLRGRRAGPGPGGRRRARLHDRASVAPADRGHHHPRRAGRGGDRPAGRRRGAAALRRHRRGPLLRPGVRPGPGPVLRDGRATPHHRGPALGALRSGDARDRQGGPGDGVAPGRRAGGRPARPEGGGVPRGVQRRGQRLPRGPLAQRAVAGVHPARARPGSTTGSRGGHRRTRSPGSRRWPGTCAATCRTRSTGRWPRPASRPSRSTSSTRRTPTAATGRSSRVARWSTAPSSR